MNYKNYIMLLSEYADKVVLQLIQKFQTENPLLTEPAIRHYIDAFEKLKGDARITKKDIMQYSFDELERVIDANFIVRPKTDGISMKPIYDDGSVQVFEGNNREECILIGNGEKWCVSRPDASNMYNSYRYQLYEPHFYFIKDSTKPDSNKWSFFVLMPFADGEFGLASRENELPFTGSEQYSWKEVVGFVPVLSKLKRLFKSKPLTVEEKRIANLVSKRITAPDLLEHFGKLSLIEHYIGWGHTLTQEQFDNLGNKELRMKYINLGGSVTDYWSMTDAEWNRYYKLLRERTIKSVGFFNLENIDRLTPPQLDEYMKENTNPDGEIKLWNLKSLPDNYRFPERTKTLDLGGLTTLDNNIQLPKYIDGDLFIHNIKSLPENFRLPGHIEGRLSMYRIKSLPTSVKFPEYIGRLSEYEFDNLEYFPNKLYQTLSDQVKSQIPRKKVK